MLTPAQSCVIVVPCFNEEKRLQTERFAHFAQSMPQTHLLFVNDGSTDGTLAILQDLKAKHPGNIDVLNQPRNTGKAEAVRHGLLHGLAQTNAVYVGFWDADLATPLDAILNMEQILDENAHVQMVFGARIRLLGRSIHRKAARHYLGRIFASAVSTMLRLPIYDTQCGAKLFRITPDLHKLFDQPFISKWIFDVEILARFLRLHRKNPGYAAGAIYELPLNSWEDVAGSRLKSSDFLRASLDLVHIRNTYLR